MDAPLDSEPGVDRSLVEATREVWNRNAVFWDQQMGEGNQFQRYLIGPAAERLLAIRPGEVVLDVACGNGVFARRLAQLGASVVAADFSEVFLEQARRRPSEHSEHIDYRLTDATDEGQLLALGIGRFDAVVCNMALMDLPVVEPLYRAVARLLKSDGRFVFTICHPCFNTTGARKLVEEADRDGEIVHAVKVVRYLNLRHGKGLGMLGQPVPQDYFDRPLSVLLGAAFRAGLVLDGLEEPAFPDDARSDYQFGWANYREIPAVLAARLRPAGGGLKRTTT